MIQVISGHLGSGNWRFKNIDGVKVLAHAQPFNADGEFRIGSDQVVGFEIEQTLQNKIKVKINFTDDRYCRAFMSANELTELEAMVSAHEAAPVFKHQTKSWVSGFIVFLVACVIFEIVK